MTIVLRGSLKGSIENFKGYHILSNFEQLIKIVHLISSHGKYKS